MARARDPSHLHGMVRLHLAVFLITCGLVACGDDDDDDIPCQHDADCPDGLECEIEHGKAFCKPHGGDDTGSGGAGSAGADGSGGTA